MSDFRPNLLAKVAAAIALLASIPATSRSNLAQEPQQKTATSGLGGVGPLVHGTPGDPLRDPRETICVTSGSSPSAAKMPRRTSATIVGA